MLGLYCILPVWVAFLCAYIYELILPIKKKNIWTNLIVAIPL
jgi:hypothetical protein